jgi:hypothetical protein
MRRFLPFEIIGWFILLAGLGALGWFMIAASFMPYDDEGYVLYSVRMFCEGHPLYSEVYSQYGPAYYLFYRGLHAVTGLVYTHDVSRLFTLGYWLGTVLVLGIITRRLGGSVPAAWFASATAFVVLVKNINESFHPGAPLAFLSALAAWAGAEFVRRENIRLMGIVVAALGAAMLLTKINVGVFLFCAFGSWWLCTVFTGASARRIVTGGLAILIAALPLVLMRAHLDTAWGASFALIFAFGAFSLGAQIRHLPAPPALPGIAPHWMVVALAFALAVIAAMAALGTSPAELWHGVVVAPLSHPFVYSAPAPTTALAATVSALSLLLSVVVLRLPESRLRTTLILGARLLVLGGFAYAATRNDGWTNLASHALVWGPASTVWLLLPLTSTPPPLLRARGWVAWVFVWQSLHAYPVAGSQVGWGSVLAVVPLALGVDEIGRWLRPRWRWTPALVAAGLACVSFFCFRPVVHNTRLWWDDSLPLAIPGATTIHPQPEVAKALTAINTTLVEDAGIVATLPGMLSFNLWSGRPSPIVANTTHWFSLLDNARQQASIQALENDPRAILVFHRGLINFLADIGIVPSGPLSDYLRRTFVPVIRLGSYDVCVKVGRTLRGYGTFKERGLVATAWTLRDTPPTGLRLRSPTRPDWPGITLPDATWTEVEPGRWLITAPFPADWPPQLARELLLEGTPAQLLIENHAPLP